LTSPRNTIRTIALGGALLLALGACSTSGAASPKPEGAAAVPATTATPTPTASEAAVDLLPLLDGVVDVAPDGWVPGSCDAMNYASPAGWTSLMSDTKYQQFQDEANPALQETVDEVNNALSQTIVFSCGTTTKWDGTWDGSGAESHRLDVPGAKYAAILAHPHSPPPVGTELSGTYFDATIQMVTADGNYYDVQFTIPDNDGAYDVVRAVASGLSIG